MKLALGCTSATKLSGGLISLESKLLLQPQPENLFLSELLDIAAHFLDKIFMHISTPEGLAALHWMKPCKHKHGFLYIIGICLDKRWPIDRRSLLLCSDGFTPEPHEPYG